MASGDYLPEYGSIPTNVIPIEYDLAQAIKGPPWKKNALCRTPDSSLVDIFYPQAGTHGGNHLIAPREYCLRCPVRYDCLEFGLEEPFGVWGGHSPSQRRRIVSMVKKGSTLKEASAQIDQRSRDSGRRPK
jgi:Transcription factor WhiB